MTDADRPATEPRKVDGDRMRWLFENYGFGWGRDGDLPDDDSLADFIEDLRGDFRAEAAQGPAPRAEGLDVPTDLLESLVDEEECRFDHHGGCQAHGYLSLQPGDLCPQHELKSIIAARLSRPSDERGPESEEPR